MFTLIAHPLGTSKTKHNSKMRGPGVRTRGGYPPTRWGTAERSLRTGTMMVGPTAGGYGSQGRAAGQGAEAGRAAVRTHAACQRTSFAAQEHSSRGDCESRFRRYLNNRSCTTRLYAKCMKNSSNGLESALVAQNLKHPPLPEARAPQSTGKSGTRLIRKHTHPC